MRDRRYGSVDSSNPEWLDKRKGRGSRTLRGTSTRHRARLIGSGGCRIGGFPWANSLFRSDRYGRAIHEKRSSGKARDARPPRQERIRA